MEVSGSGSQYVATSDTHQGRLDRPRRSFTNLSHLSLAPLSTRLPVDEVESPEDERSSQTQWHRSSYIQGKSAPTTPGILSRSTSPIRALSSRLSPNTAKQGFGSSKSFTHLAFADTELPKSRSTTGLVQPLKRKVKVSAKLGSSDASEWLFRAGTAISSEARDSKGQSWLLSRASSTSLVAQDVEDDVLAVAPGQDEVTHPHSRKTSRVSSARTSRRASRVGSRADLTYFTSTPAVRSTKTPGSTGHINAEDYFGDVESAAEFAGPDFVDGIEDEVVEEDDEEVKLEEAEVGKLTRDKGFGLGSVVDRLIGWTLFEVKDDDNEMSEDDVGGTRKRGDSMNQDEERQSDATAELLPRSGKSQRAQDIYEDGAKGVKKEEAGGWHDAAWLLSVASKVLL